MNPTKPKTQLAPAAPATPPVMSTTTEDFVPPAAPTPTPAPANKIVETRPLIIAKPEPVAPTPAPKRLHSRTMAEQEAGRRALRK